MFESAGVRGCENERENISVSSAKATPWDVCELSSN
jgi:hypothetical protein